MKELVNGNIAALNVSEINYVCGGIGFKWVVAGAGSTLVFITILRKNGYSTQVAINIAADAFRLINEFRRLIWP